MQKRSGRTLPRPWQPMERVQMKPMDAGDEAELRARITAESGPEEADRLITEMRNAELWANHKYVVTVSRREGGSVGELSIRRQDRKAGHDWRDFQRIKTEIAGADTEGFEIYPAESRLMDTANQYYIFCLPPGQMIPAGYVGPREIRDTDDQLATSEQRPLPADWKCMKDRGD